MVGVTYLAAKPAGPVAGVRKATANDLDACAAIINRTHAGLDLFRPYSPERLAEVLDEGFWSSGPRWRTVYGWDDFLLLEEAGQIVACAGLWDRGRDMRESWRGPNGETRTVEVAATLDIGCAEGRGDALAALLRHELAAPAAERGRQSLIVDLERLPAVRRIASPISTLPGRAAHAGMGAPSTDPNSAEASSGDCHTLDLRYW